MANTLAPYYLCLLILMCFVGCSPPDSKVEAAKAAEIANVIRFFDSIPKGSPSEGKLKCYRKGRSGEVILELHMPIDKDRKKISRDRLFELMGTYFTVQEIRDKANYGISLTCIEYELAGKELTRATIRFSEIMPHFNGHNF